MGQWRSTVFTEHAPKSPNEVWGPGSSRFTRELDITDGSFNARMQAQYDILGYSSVVATGNTDYPYYIHRVTPMPYPAINPALIIQDESSVLIPDLELPDMRRSFYAVGTPRTEPLGAPNGIDLNAIPIGTIGPNYTRARLTTQFATLPYLIKEDSEILNSSGFPMEGDALQFNGWPATRYIIKQAEPFCQILKLPYGTMWVNGKNTHVGIPRREPGAYVTYTWLQVPVNVGPIPGVNLTLLGRMQGTINSGTFDGFTSQTLLFDTWRIRQYQGTFGEALVDVTFKFIYLPKTSTGKAPGNVAGVPQGWNYNYDILDGKNDYYPIFADKAMTNRPYQVDSKYIFADMFRPIKTV